VREIKNEVSIRQIISRTRRFCHMSRSISFSSLVWQGTLFWNLIYGFDHMSVCSFWGCGSWLDFFFFGFVDMNCDYRKSNNYLCGETNNSRLTVTLNNSLVSTRHPKQTRTSPSYCSVNLTGLGGRGGKVRELRKHWARAMNLITVFNLFFVTATLNKSPPVFRHCK